MSDRGTILDVTDAEQIGPNEYQPAPIVIRSREVAMWWSRAVADIKDQLDRGAITGNEANRLWTRVTWQARDMDTKRTTGIVVVREKRLGDRLRRARG